jgi:DNA-binding response OmpR family regulator
MQREPINILMVDDDRDFCDALGVFLRSRGFRVTAVHRGADGLAEARRSRPDLILMDVIMGERTEGFFTVQQMRRDPTLDGVPIFVVSSLYARVPEFRIEPDRGWLGHDEFFPKPVDADALADRIAARLELRESSTPSAVEES